MHSQHLPRAVATLAAAAVAAGAIAACGGSNRPPAGGSGGPASASSGAADAYRFSACMRSHGVSGFQDPHVSTDGNQVKVAIHVDPAITGSPGFRAAQHACSQLLPDGGNGPSPAQQRARAQAILAFAGCMRRHGFPKFPDPTAQGRLTPQMLASAGIDLQQPAIKGAAYACIPLTHGLLTRAQVDQAVRNGDTGGSQSSSGGG